MAANKASPKSRVTTVTAKKAGDTSALITNGSDAFPEDSFTGSYMVAGNLTSTGILEPTYKPGTLRWLCQQNNILNQCIDAMEVNIDGTGHKIELFKDMPENEKELTILEDFFHEPFPGKSMVTIRREIRRDIEESGNGYLEVIRNALDELVMCNNLEADVTRLLRMDDPVTATKSLRRGGVDVNVSYRTRERRFVQTINGKKVYFREFGSTRDLHRLTGEWAPLGTRLPLDQRASEVIHFTMTKEAKTPYGVPRWINQLPSVLGSRKAEQFNLDFFDSGGLPPLLVLVQGGYLGDDLKDQLIKHLSGSNSSKHRAAIVEAVSASGTLDSAGSVKVTVERFGADRQKDAMFQEYDKNAEEHVRTAFRLPPIFLGRAQDYNFATAMTGYMVAEAQVFAPERYEFDEIINNTIVKGLGVKNYFFQSLPINMTNVENQLKAIELTLGGPVDPESSVNVLNEITGLALEYKKQEAPPAPVVQPVAPTAAPVAPVAGKASEAPQPIEPVAKDDGGRLTGLIHLANGWSAILGINGESTTGLDIASIKKQVSGLDATELRQFNEIMASKSLSMSSVDLEGLAELCGCGTDLMGHN